MRRLRGGVPRAYRRHKGPEAFQYRLYVLAVLARLGPVPESARPTLKECGRLVVELDRLAEECEAPRLSRQARSRLRRQRALLRFQLVKLEERLETLAGPKPPSLADLFAPSSAKASSGSS